MRRAERFLLYLVFGVGLIIITGFVIWEIAGRILKVSFKNIFEREEKEN